MKLSMYHASAPRFANTLRNLSAILDKAQAHAEAKKIDPAVLGAVARLAGVEIPKHEDTEQTPAELRQRIAKTLDFILSVKPETLEGSDDKEVTLKMRGQETRFSGLQYLLGHAYPNFYFHVSTAYNILRANGVDIGKADYIGKP